jgi:wyosine [tRNA(Phe)-imidazoG37] synthetase (radical SAM superfamily)
MPAQKTLFGPVPSRRFGRSLGIDLVPLKTCTLDCVFCQLGRTPAKTLERKDYVPIDMVISQLQEWLAADNQADVLTLSGSGEPTLHAHFDRVLEFINSHSDIPSLLLTNATLLNLPEVRTAAAQAAMVKTSLCAWDHKSFQRINRPHPALDFSSFVQGQLEFRDEFQGQLILEVFLLKGVSNSPDQIQALADIARRITPDRIHLNTVERPPAESSAKPVSLETLEWARSLFTPTAELARSSAQAGKEQTGTDEAAILETIRRRPCTLSDLAAIYGLHQNEIAKYVTRLVNKGQVHWVHGGSDQPYVTSVDHQG